MEHLTSVPFTKEMPVFGKIGTLAAIASMTPDEYTLYQDSKDAYRTTVATFAFHEKKGIEKGMTKGREEGREEERQKAYKEKLASASSLKGFGKLSNKEIADSLGLTEEEVEKA